MACNTCLHVSAAVQQLPPQISMASAREEAEMVLFESVKNVLQATGLKPGQVSFCHYMFLTVYKLLLFCHAHATLHGPGPAAANGTDLKILTHSVYYFCIYASLLLLHVHMF